MRISRSFSARLSTNILLITSLLFISSILVVSYYSHKLIGEEATKNASNVLNSATLDINKTLGKVENSVTNMEWIVKEHLTDSSYLYHIVSELVKTNDEIVGSAVAFRSDFYAGKRLYAPYAYEDGEGAIQTKNIGVDKYDYYRMEWFTVAYETKKPHWSEPYFDEGGGQIVMATYSFPLLDEKGEVFAVLTADISLDWLNEKMNAMHPYEHSMTIVLGRDGTYVSHYEKERILNQKIFDFAREVGNPRINKLGEKMVSGDSGTYQMRHGDDIAFAVYGPLGNGWSAAIISLYKDVFAHIMRLNLIITIVSASGLFLLFILCFKTIQKLTQPITEFSVAALNMAKGNFQARLPQIKTQDEMLQLHDSFEYMQKSLTHYITELRTSTAQNERFESELNIARDIQLSMVPTNFPTSDNCSIFATLRPAKEVGGDLYDYIIKDDVLYFAIGDVSGKGVPAALFMSVTKAAFHFIVNLGFPINQVVTKINDSLSESNDKNMFVTFFAGKIDLKTGEMEYCNGGHNPLVLCHPDGRAEFMQAKPNLAMGVFPGFEYEAEQVRLEKGSRILLYTDGVTEAEDVSQNQFGEDRLLQFSQTIGKDEKCQEIVDRLIDEVKSFTKDAVQNDDITIMTIKLI